MSLEFPYLEIGDRVRTRRKNLKKTQDQIAKEIGLTRSSLANIERGEQRILVHQLYDIAKALNINVGLLIPEPPKVERDTSFNIAISSNSASESTVNSQTAISDIEKLYHQKG